MKSRSDHKSRHHNQNVNEIFKIVILKSEGVDLWEWAKKSPRYLEKGLVVVLESVGVIEKNSGLRKKYHLDIEIKKHTRSIFKKVTLKTKIPHLTHSTPLFTITVKDLDLYADSYKNHLKPSLYQRYHGNRL